VAEDVRNELPNWHICFNYDAAVSVSLNWRVSRRGPHIKDCSLWFNYLDRPEGHLLQPCPAAGSSPLLKPTHSSFGWHLLMIRCWEMWRNEGAIRGQRSNVTGDTAAIIKTYERRALIKTSPADAFPSPHPLVQRSFDVTVTRYERCDSALRGEKSVCWVTLMCHNVAWRPPLSERFSRFLVVKPAELFNCRVSRHSNYTD